MSRKYLGNDSENRRVFSCCGNMDNDSADVTSVGMSFHVLRQQLGRHGWRQFTMTGGIKTASTGQNEQINGQAGQ